MATGTATPFMVWKDTWLVGVTMVDTQHKKLVALINQLHDAMRSGQGSKIMGRVLAELVDYTKAHFSAEEQLLSVNGYTDLPNHKREHIKFTSKVIDLQKDFEAGNTTLSIEVMQFLSEWLREHILGTDKKYAPFLQSKGVK